MLLQQSATISTCDPSQISSGTARFLSKTGGQLGRKCCCWLKMPCTIFILGFINLAIPIPGFINLADELSLTFECFCSSLQQCTHSIWAKLALGMLIFGQKWGTEWQKMLWLAKNAMYGSHPRLYKPFS